jgi:AcrR family transcriptional regulator
MPASEGVRTSKYAILDTFARRVAELGYDEVSIRLIAEDLGLSKGTIVHHYGSKDKLLEALHNEYMARRLKEAHAILERFEEPAECVAAIIAQLIVAQRDDRASTVAFAREIARFARLDLMAEVRSMRNEYSQLLRAVVQRGMEQGDFRPDNADLITLQIFGMCNWSWTWMRPEGRWSVAEIVRTWTTNILSGLVVRDAVSTAIDTARIVTTVEEIMAAVAAEEGVSDRLRANSRAPRRVAS